MLPATVNWAEGLQDLKKRTSIVREEGELDGVAHEAIE
jgi:hypothetical protein